MLFAFALVIGAYYAFRFSGRWAEWDTASQADSVKAMVKDATLIPLSGIYYTNGYAFGAVSTFIVAFTGLDVPTLLQLVYPLVSASLVLIAWPTYRELTGSTRAAALATLILFLQPEFLFVILRGSHERVLRGLLLLSLWLLARSLGRADRQRSYSAYVALFYMTVYGLVATNSFFGSSYMVALLVTLGTCWAGGFLGPGLHRASAPTRQRLLYVPLLCGVIVFLFNFYVYPPAGNSVGQLPDVLDRLSRLLLTTSPDPAFDPYVSVLEQWVDVRLYFLLSTATFGLIVISAIVWVRMGLRWLAQSIEPPTPATWLLWSLYGAFALQSAVSILADRAGMLGGNLQHRSFPSFVMVAAPLVAIELCGWRLNGRQRPLAAVVLAVLALFAITKATNEPAVSNKWTFYEPGETLAVSFANDRVRDPGGYWTDFDERLRAAYALQYGNTVSDVVGAVLPTLRTFVLSDVIRVRAARLRQALPPVGGELRIYDNGTAQIYRLRSRSVYQD